MPFGQRLNLAELARRHAAAAGAAAQAVQHGRHEGWRPEVPRAIPLSDRTTATQAVAGPGKFIDAVFASKLAATYTAGLYDTQLTAAVAASTIAANQQFSFFTTGSGVSGSTSAVFNTGVKNNSDTNLKGPGGIMAMNQTHIARSFGVHVFLADISGNMSATASYQQALLDVQQILTGFFVTYSSGPVLLVWGTLQQWPGGGGAFGTTGGVGPATSMATGYVASNGLPTPTARTRLAFPVVFTGGESFTLGVNNAQAIQQLLTLRWDLQTLFWGTWKDHL